MLKVIFAALTAVCLGAGLFFQSMEMKELNLFQTISKTLFSSAPAAQAAPVAPAAEVSAEKK